MAVRKLYTLCITTSWLGQRDTPFCAFTLARSEEEVRSIVRRHVSRQRTFTVDMATSGGPKEPDIAARIAELFEEYGFRWLHPQGPPKGEQPPIGDVIVRLMEEGLAL